MLLFIDKISIFTGIKQQITRNSIYFCTPQNTNIIKLLKYIVITLAVAAVTIYGASLLLRLDAVQHRAAHYVTSAIQQLSDLPLSVGSVQVQHLNKVVLKDIHLADERGDTAVNIPKITAHLSPWHMLKGDIRINTLMIGAPAIKLYRADENASLNIQFILDKLAGDPEKEKSKLPDIRINHIQIYDGSVCYDVESAAIEREKFSPHHIAVRDIACNLSLKKLNSDTLSLYIRSIRGKEQTSIEIDELEAKINANPQQIKVEDFHLVMPASDLRADKFVLKSNKEGTFDIDGELYSNRISAGDFKALHPALGTNLPTLNMRVKSKGNERKTTANITLNAADNSLQLKANAIITNSLKSEKRTIGISIPEGKIKETAIAHIQKIISDSTGKLNTLKRIGDMQLKGTASISKGDFTGDIDLATGHGDIAAEIQINDKEGYNTALQASAMDLGTILQNKQIGTCNVEFTANGTLADGSPTGEFHSTISEFGYNGYKYAPILINGNHSKTDFTTTATFIDENACGEIFVLTTDKENHREFRVKARIDSLRPHKLMLSKEGNGTLSAILEGNCEIHGNGKSQLDARLYNITLATAEEQKSLRTLHITDNNLTDTRLLLLSSDFMDMNIAGHFSYQGIANTFGNILRHHLPATTYSKQMIPAYNEYSFKIDIKDTRLLSDLLGLPVTVHEQSSIVGSCDDNRRLFYLNSQFNNCDIDGRKYRKLNVTAVASDERITLDANFACPQVAGKKVLYDHPENDIAATINCIAGQNRIDGNIKWERQAQQTDKGTFEFDIELDNNDRKQIIFDAHIKPSSITYNGTAWELLPCHIQGNGEQYTIDKFRLQSDKQWMKIDGVVGKSEDDILSISLKDISVEEIQNLVNFHSVDFGGKATGDITLSRILQSPQFSSKLNVKNFSFEEGYMGELDVNGVWKEEDKAIHLHGDIYDNAARTVINGFISPANDTINLKVDADKTRVEFLNSMLDGIISEVDGYVTGKVSVVGPLGGPNLVGNIRANGSLRLNVTNTKYKMIDGEVNLTHNKMTFNNFPIADIYGNRGRINGAVNHNSLSDFTCTLNVDAENLLAYHTEGFGEYPFYGTAFVTGLASLTADDRGIFLHADIRSNEGSSFVYDAGSMGNVTSNNFITFTDNSKRHVILAEKEKRERYRNTLLSRLNLEFILDITPEMQLKVFTNVKTGDYIDFYGEGPITAIYDEKDGFSMKGHLDLERGTYKFTMQDIFPKEFDIIDGSTLTFEGDPFDAELNLKTKYLVSSASLSDLDPSGKRHKSVKVNCLMNITGKLEAPQLSFDIELPDANEEQRELLATAINTPEQKNMQFIYLMGIGKFYTYDYNRNNSATESSTAMESLISNTISGQLNNMLSQIIDNRNWNISGNFSSSERGWNSMEVEGILEGRLLDNRLLINGNFGYRENPLANTNFVGDFEVQWLLDKNGNVSLKAYNKTNDRYFSESSLTTQGAGIILRHDFNEWLWWLKNRNKKSEGEDTEK